MNESAKCELCGEPMPEGEEMFKFHGYSGPCPKPPLAKPETVSHAIAVAVKVGDDNRLHEDLSAGRERPFSALQEMLCCLAHMYFRGVLWSAGQKTRRHFRVAAHPEAKNHPMICTSCHRDKPESEYYRRRFGGLEKQCKACRRKRKAERRSEKRRIKSHTPHPQHPG